MLLSKLSAELTFFTNIVQDNIHILMQLILALWLINIINWNTGSKLNCFGVIPRKTKGLIGIFLGTFIHKNFNHLFFNTIPLVALGIFMLAAGLTTFYTSSLLIILIEGILVWLFARSGVHLGASSLISGYFSYLLISAYYNPSATTIIIAMLTIYYFGSIFFGIFPSAAKISWEGHLFGFIAGIISYLICLH